MAGVQSRETIRFCIAVYLFTAAWHVVSYQLHRALGGGNVSTGYILFAFLFFLVWAPAVPLIVHVARRFPFARGRRLRAIDVHFFVALALSFGTLVLHKIAWCPSFDCMTDYTPGAWMARWLVLDYLFYGMLVASIWILDAHEAMRRRELRASAMERELSSTELHLVNAQIDPRTLIDLFGWLRVTLRSEPDQAQRMVSRLADFLRLNVHAIGATHWTMAEDVELLTAWLSVESLRRGTRIELDATLDDGVYEIVMASPVAQPIVARTLPPDTARVALSIRGGNLVVTADGRELGRSSLAA